MNIRSRFAPSPTGYLHIGSLRSALYAYAFAKHDNGVFILRIEDTDRTRYVPGSTEKIYEQLKIFCINWDEGPLVGGPFSPYIQSERVGTGIYKKYAQQLLDKDHAYFCFCKPKTKEEIKLDHQNKISSFRDNNCRNLTPAQIKEKIDAGEKPAIRLRVPDNQNISFYDFVVKKDITWNTNYVDETILLKSDGFPTYQLAVVVDDAAMEITHIIRALEWLPSTPIHLLLFEYLGFNKPQIGHLTDILDPDGGKLSKRKGNVSTQDFLNNGYLPEAILNFIMLLGWAPKDNREIYTLKEFVQNFDVHGLQKSNPMLNITKLNWFNQYYIRKTDNEELTARVQQFSKLNSESILKLLPLVKDRLVTLKDFDNLTDYFFHSPNLDKDPAIADILSISKETLNHAIPVLEENFDGQYLEKMAREFCGKNNIKVGNYFMALRVAITGKTQTPPLWDIMQILGKVETLKRLRQ